MKSGGLMRSNFMFQEQVVVAGRVGQSECCYAPLQAPLPNLLSVRGLFFRLESFSFNFSILVNNPKPTVLLFITNSYLHSVKPLPHLYLSLLNLFSTPFILLISIVINFTALILGIFTSCIHFAAPILGIFTSCIHQV